MKPHVVLVDLDQLVLTVKFLADCGNTCSKIAALDDISAVAYVADEDLAAWFADQEPSALLILSGNAQRAQLVGQTAEAHQWQHDRLETAAIHCGQYPGMGGDRLCAGIAAIDACQSDVIVIDAGTMLTFGAWRFDTEFDFNCAFVGGFIAPGPQSSLRAMHHAAPTLPALDYVPQHSIGTDTESHMQAAIAYGWPAMAQALFDTLQAQLPQAQCLRTGGWSDELPFSSIKNRADLVLRGMQCIANHKN